MLNIILFDMFIRIYESSNVWFVCVCVVFWPQICGQKIIQFSL